MIEKKIKKRQNSGRFFHFTAPDRNVWLYATAARLTGRIKRIMSEAPTYPTPTKYNINTTV